MRNKPKNSIEVQAHQRMVERSKGKEPRKFKGLCFLAINTFRECADCISYNEVMDHFDSGFSSNVFGYGLGEDITEESVKQLNNRCFGDRLLLKGNLSRIAQNAYLGQLLFFERRHLSFGAISPN